MFLGCLLVPIRGFSSFKDMSGVTLHLQDEFLEISSQDLKMRYDIPTYHSAFNVLHKAVSSFLFRVVLFTVEYLVY